MKKIFLILTLFSFNFTFSQNILVEFSIKWLNETGNIDKSIQGNVPYLIITYKNNTEKDLYFLKGLSSTNGIPPFVKTRIYLNNLSGQISKLDFKDSNNNNNYNVYIGGAQYCNVTWEVLLDTINFYKGHEGNKINDELFNFYKEFSIQGKKDTLYKLFDSYHLKDNLKINNTTNSLINSFVFLKAGNFYSEQFNLIGFTYLKGNFKFCLSDTILTTFVYGEPSWDKILKKWVFDKIELPQRVNEYFLYSGTFQKNSVEIKF